MRKQRSSFILNDKEAKVYGGIPPLKDGEPVYVEISTLAKEVFPREKISSRKRPKDGTSWVRNSLRKLVRLGLVKQLGGRSGQYARTQLTPAEVLAEAEKSGACPPAEDKAA